MKKLIIKGEYEEPEWLSDGAFRSLRRGGTRKGIR